MRRTPDLTRPILGFRAWRVDPSGELCALFMRQAWQRGTNRAECCDSLSDGRPGKHSAPDADCECGIYALHDVNRRYVSWLSTDEPVIVGAIAAWGVVEVHGCGFRAERARILALGKTFTPHKHARTAAARYGVPLVPIEHLEEVALRSAEPVSRAMLPEQRPITVVVDCQRESRLVSIESMRRGLALLIPEVNRPDALLQIITCGRSVQYVPVDLTRQDEVDVFLDLLSASGTDAAIDVGIRAACAQTLPRGPTTQPTAIVLIGSHVTRPEGVVQQVTAAATGGANVLVGVPSTETALLAALGEHGVAMDPERYAASARTLGRQASVTVRHLSASLR